MSDIQNTVNKGIIAGDRTDKATGQTNSAVPSTSSAGGKEKNYTDPKVCHDPSLTCEGITTIYYNENKTEMDEGELSTNNTYDAKKTDAILYPLLSINNRNISHDDIIEMTLYYDSFVPHIKLIIYDELESEQKYNSTQMSGLIRICMIPTVDKVYRKILMNFKIESAVINPYNPAITTYTGSMDIPLFKQTNIGHIWMPEVCPKSPTCMQGAHINANTWEMLHKIAEMTGLGFAATKRCKEIEDRVIRNVFTQRFDEFIEEQLTHCGLTEENIFDAWVDLYGYIVMVNVPWVLSQDIVSEDLTNTATIGMHSASNTLPEQKPEPVERTLTDFNRVGAVSNLQIKSYDTIISNHAVHHGTLEHVFIVDFVGTKTKMRELDVQTKQNSVDGEYLEDYNTGKNRPIPKFNFNIDEYTELQGGYDLDNQKVIRNAFFRKHRQQILEVTLKYLNFGLQRGCLVNLAIFEDNTKLKKNIAGNVNNLSGSMDVNQSHIDTPPEYDEKDMLLDEGTQFPNFKLSGLYYIDGMRFEYNAEEDEMVQVLILFKKGITSGYHNRHTMPKAEVPEERTTLPQDQGGSLPYENVFK